MLVAQTSVYLVGRFTITHGFADCFDVDTPAREGARSAGRRFYRFRKRCTVGMHQSALGRRSTLLRRLVGSPAGLDLGRVEPPPRRFALRGRSVAHPGRGRRGRLRLARTPRRGCWDQIYRRRVGGAAPAGESVPGGGFSGGDIDLREIALPVPRLVMPTGGSW